MNRKRGPADALSERRRVWLEATAEVMGKLHGPARPEEVVDQIARGARAVAGGELAALLRVRDGVPSIVAPAGTGQAELPALLAGVSAAVRSALPDKAPQWVRTQGTGPATGHTSGW